MSVQQISLLVTHWPLVMTMREATPVSVLQDTLEMDSSIVRVSLHLNPIRQNLNTSYHTDIDECELNMDNCDSNADCTDTIGSFNCTCVFGYTGTGQQCGMLAVYMWTYMKLLDL